MRREVWPYVKKFELDSKSCLINGFCQASGYSPGTCQVCDPSFSQYMYAPAKGSKCVVDIAGSLPAFKDGDLVTARFQNLRGLDVGKDGAIYVADTGNQRIRKISKGKVTTIAGEGTKAHLNGPALQAKFYEPWDVAVDDVSGDIYVAQSGGNSSGEKAFIRVISGGKVDIFAGGGKIFIDDKGKFDWKFWNPRGVAVGLLGKVYASDRKNHQIVEISGSNIKSIAGYRNATFKTGYPGNTNGAAGVSRVNHPRGLSVGPNNTVYVADVQSSMVRRISAANIATTIASGLNEPQDVAYDAKTGSVYVAVATGNQILTIDKNNKTTVLAGTGVAGHANGQGTKAKFSDPHGVAVDKNGFVFVADRANHRVRVINPN